MKVQWVLLAAAACVFVAVACVAAEDADDPHAVMEHWLGDWSGEVAGGFHGGAAQGLGLALLEEIQIRDGQVRNGSFTDYLIPTILDVPSMPLTILEHPDPHAPYGLRGAGEPPTLSSTPAIAAAVRDATGLALRRVPIRPDHIAGSAQPPA